MPVSSVFICPELGLSVRLGECIGKGGEGSVYAIRGHDGMVAKVYAMPPSGQRSAKLAAMTQASTGTLQSVSAWPKGLLRSSSGNVVGFVMPRVTARRSAHELYGPKSRLAHFPDVDYRFLVHVCANICRAFETVHQAGHVIGDVNHGNLLVAQDGTVALIDADSFQVCANGLVYTCDVGTPEFTPPELLGTRLAGLHRTTDHDHFGLAVILFQLLFMGRHPFAGRYKGPGEMPIERAIAEARFAYSRHVNTTLMERPPHTLDLDHMGQPVAQLFERAFMRRGNGVLRPTAIEWGAAMVVVSRSLRQCQISAAHFYASSRSDCSWCRLEKESGVRFFGTSVSADQANRAVDLSALWAAIEAVPSPGEASEEPGAWRTRVPARVVPPPMARWPGLQKISDRYLGWVIGLYFLSLLGGYPAIVAASTVLFLGLLFLLDYNQSTIPHDRYQDNLKAKETIWIEMLTNWNRNASTRPFIDHKSHLQSLRKTVHQYNRRLEAMQHSHGNFVLDAERQAYLDRFRISSASLPMIGSGRKATLASYGIETAADVTERAVLAVPGFGTALANELLAWRRSHERNYRPTAAPVPVARQPSTDEKQLIALREALVCDLQKGPLTLQQVADEIADTRIRLLPELRKAWANLEDARAGRGLT